MQITEAHISCDITSRVKNNSLTRKATLGKTIKKRRKKKPETEESEVILNTDYKGHYMQQLLIFIGIKIVFVAIEETVIILLRPMLKGPWLWFCSVGRTFA